MRAKLGYVTAMCFSIITFWLVLKRVSKSAHVQRPIEALEKASDLISTWLCECLYDVSNSYSVTIDDINKISRPSTTYYRVLQASHIRSKAHLTFFLFEDLNDPDYIAIHCDLDSEYPTESNCIAEFKMLKSGLNSITSTLEKYMVISKFTSEVGKDVNSSYKNT